MGPWVAGFDGFVRRRVQRDSRFGCTDWIALGYVYTAYTNIENGNENGLAYAFRCRTPFVNPYLRTLACGLDSNYLGCEM
jgi:hypothetical protein